MMIKSVDIKNYQIHRDLTLEFDPGVNVIVGESDAGKSAIIRALNWVINNQPSGDAYRRDRQQEKKWEVMMNNKVLNFLSYLITGHPRK